MCNALPILSMKNCRFKHCGYLHESTSIPDGEEIKIGISTYYHSDCYKTKQDIQEIADLFINNINSNVVYSQLLSVINNIIFNKGMTTDFLLFGLKYYINNKIPLNYPQGLYYVIQNKKMTEAYNKMKANEIKEKIQEEINNSKDEFGNTKQFGYIKKETKTISDLLGG